MTSPNILHLVLHFQFRAFTTIHNHILLNLYVEMTNSGEKDTVLRYIFPSSAKTSLTIRGCSAPELVTHAHESSRLG
jgi:hypothetical protein